MYKSTNWLDRVVDAGSGEVIQEGTDQSAANFNNMEKGIADAHLAISLMENALRNVIDERFQVLDCYIQDDGYDTLDYPQGFTWENCAVVAVRYRDGKFSDIADMADNSDITVSLKASCVYVKSNRSVGTDSRMKIILYRFG